MRWILTALLAACAMASTAAPVQVFDRAALAPNDAVDWSRLADGSVYPSPLPVSSLSGRSVLADDGVGFTALTEGLSWIGVFSIGDPLLFTSIDQTDAGSSESLLLTFAEPVYGVGTQIQANYYGPYSAGLQLYSGSSVIASFVVAGLSTPFEDGSAPYLGALDSAPTITAARYTILTPSASCARLDLDCGFAINQLDVRALAEPPGFAVLAATLAAAAGLRRRPAGIARHDVSAPV